MLRMCGSWLLLCVAVGVSSCTFDFTGISRDTIAGMSLQVSADTKTGQLLLNATLEPGLDVNGEVRSVRDELNVEGAVIAPVLMQEHGRRTYAVERTLSAVQFTDGSVSVVAPHIEGFSSDHLQLSLPLARAIGPDSLFIAGDEPVVLRISDPPARDWAAQWSLQLTDTDSTGHVFIQARGYPPAEIAMPRSWFRNGASTYDVRLSINQQRSGDFVPERYRWSASTVTHLHWTVIFTDDASAPTRDSFSHP